MIAGAFKLPFVKPGMIDEPIDRLVRHKDPTWLTLPPAISRKLRLAKISRVRA